MFTWSDIDKDIENKLLSSVKRNGNIAFQRYGTRSHYG